MTDKGKNHPARVWFGMAIEGCGFSLFNTAHFLLAVRYHKIATETPLMLDGLPIKA